MINKNKIKSALINLVIYSAIVFGIIFGFPKALSWYLDTPYPMAAITSGSMWPTLKEGYLIFIKSVPKEDLKIGDIIVYRNNLGFTIHRIVKLSEDELITKGDANFQNDTPIKYGDVVGRTLTVFDKQVYIPYLGIITIKANKK
ncbi:MAG: signal peptidase I [Parcubacteria group bacterium]|nr:signal peptidase I [Parcubacteria group bacterium]MCR4342827.1 signal peptidase I [Patescibacteria group bacterium]